MGRKNIRDLGLSNFEFGFLGLRYAQKIRKYPIRSKHFQTFWKCLLALSSLRKNFFQEFFGYVELRWSSVQWHFMHLRPDTQEHAGRVLKSDINFFDCQRLIYIQRMLFLLKNPFWIYTASLALRIETKIYCELKKKYRFQFSRQLAISNFLKMNRSIGDALALEYNGGIKAVSERCNALASILSFPDVPSLLISTTSKHALIFAWFAQKLSLQLLVVSNSYSREDIFLWVPKILL